MIKIERKIIQSTFLEREVLLDIYLPQGFNIEEPSSLLLINDGQDLLKMPFDNILSKFFSSHFNHPVLSVGIHASSDRKNEYGTANILDYEGRGAKAKCYQQFVLQELLPMLRILYGKKGFDKMVFAGFSLGGLMALDMIWHYPNLFSTAGVFSGSLWWRTKALDDGYNEETDRIMHQQVKEGAYQSGLRFYFTTGSLDETADRNNNGIIDSIDDTLALIEQLEIKGYQPKKEIEYINFEDGKHDVATWARALPHFLEWCFTK